MTSIIWGEDAAARGIAAIIDVRRFPQRLLAALLLGCVALMPLSGARIYPTLLGTHEYRRDGIGKFPKWAGMLQRWQDSAPCETADCTTSGWQALIDRLKGQGLAAQLAGVNNFFNASRYTVDQQNWGREDYWETPYEFLKRRGDCEDYAIAKFMALKALGVSEENMRILALRDLRLGVGHAVLIVYDGDTPMLLDNQIKTVVPANSVSVYQPIYSINETGWWMHKPS